MTAPPTKAAEPRRRATPKQAAPSKKRGVEPKDEKTAPPKLSAKERGRLGAALARGKAKARSQADHESSAKSVEDFQAAAIEPKQETAGRALEGHAKKFEKNPPADPMLEVIITQLRMAMWLKRPADEDALGKVKPEAYAKEASTTLNGNINSQVGAVKGNYDSFQQKPEGTPSKVVTPLKAHAAAPDAAAINAKRVRSDPVTSADVSLDEDQAQVDQSATRGKLDHPNAELVEDGPVVEARQARGEFGELAKTGPATALKSDKELRASAEETFKKAEVTARKRMMAARKGQIGSVDTDKENAVGEDQKKRVAFGKRLDGIFAKAEIKVRPILDAMVDGALDMWTKGIEPLSKQFDARLSDVDRWIKKRKESTLSRIGDSIFGLPGWIVRRFESAERDFVNGAIRLIRRVSNWVRGKVAICQSAIATAREEIEREISELPDEMAEFGEQERDRMAARFGALEAAVEKARKGLNRQLGQKLFRTVEAKRAKVAKLREASKGLLQKVQDFVSEFVDDPLRAMINGLLRILGIPPAAFWGLIDKFKTVISDIADKPKVFANNLVRAMKRGFEMFKENILSHLIQGLMRWLTSKLPDVTVPKELSVKGVVVMVLQVLGISWPKIRTKIARYIGEKNMKRIEMAVKMITAFISKGVEGIWEFLKNQFNPMILMNAAIDSIKSYIIETIIKRATLEVVKLLNPVGAIVKAVELIYTVVRWVLDNAAKIFTLIESVVNGAANIMKGAIGGAAKLIEGALGQLVPIVIDLFAKLIGLGGLPLEIKKIVMKLRDRVEEVIDKAVAWVAKKIGLKSPDEKDQDKDSAVGEVVRFAGPKEGHRLYFEVKDGNATAMVASEPMTVVQRLATFSERLKGKGGESEIQDISKREEAEALIAKARKLNQGMDGKADALVRDFHKEEKAAFGEGNKAVVAHEHQLAATLARIYELFGESAGADKFDQRVDYGSGEISYAMKGRNIDVQVSGNRGPASLSPRVQWLRPAAKNFAEKSKEEWAGKKLKDKDVCDKIVAVRAAAKKSATPDQREEVLGTIKEPLQKLSQWSWLGFGDVLQRAAAKVLVHAGEKTPASRTHHVTQSVRTNLREAQDAAREKSKEHQDAKPDGQRKTTVGQAPAKFGIGKDVSTRAYPKRELVDGLGKYKEIRDKLGKLDDVLAQKVRDYLMGEANVFGPTTIKVESEGEVVIGDLEVYAQRLRVLIHVEAVREGTAMVVLQHSLAGITSAAELAGAFETGVFAHARRGFVTQYKKKGAEMLDKQARALVEKAVANHKLPADRAVLPNEKLDPIVAKLENELLARYNNSST